MLIYSHYSEYISTTIELFRNTFSPSMDCDEGFTAWEELGLNRNPEATGYCSRHQIPPIRSCERSLWPVGRAGEEPEMILPITIGFRGGGDPIEFRCCPMPEEKKGPDQSARPFLEKTGAGLSSISSSHNRPNQLGQRPGESW